MPQTFAQRALRHRLPVVAAAWLATAGCGGAGTTAPQALPAVAKSHLPRVVASPSAARPAEDGADQLRIVSGVVRTWIHRINVKHERENGRLRILVFTPHIDSATTADVYVALERGRSESTPLLDREIELRLIRGRWVITEALPT